MDLYAKTRFANGISSSHVIIVTILTHIRAKIKVPGLSFFACINNNLFSYFHKKRETISLVLNKLDKSTYSQVRSVAFYVSGTELLFFILIYLLLFYDSSAL